MAYNRPEYFEQTLQSIKDQLTGLDIHLFMDGPHPSKPTDHDKIQKTISLFQNTFPNSPVHTAAYHIGPQNGVVKIFNHMFGVLNADYVLWIEDDIIFEPNYMEQLNLLIDLCKDDDEVVVMSCFGRESHNWSDEKLETQYQQVVNMHNICGSVWKRSAWETLKPHFDKWSELYNKFCYPETRDVLRYGTAQEQRTYIDAMYLYLQSLGIYKECWGIDAIIGFILAASHKYRVSTAGEYLTNIGLYGYSCDGKHLDIFDKRICPKLATSLYLDKRYIGLQHQLNYMIGKNADDALNWKERLITN
jgi:hypothetical protein